MLERADTLGFTASEHYLWPACQWSRLDPTTPLQTVVTELAEMGVADQVLESITGHLSRRMLEHFSHIRLDAKRAALDALDEWRTQDRVAASANEREADKAERDHAAPDGPTSQSTSQCGWHDLAERAKLLIPLVRRDGRVVEGARLEIDSVGAH
jgi:hypothetical protein